MARLDRTEVERQHGVVVSIDIAPGERVEEPAWIEPNLPAPKP